MNSQQSDAQYQVVQSAVENWGRVRLTGKQRNNVRRQIAKRIGVPTLADASVDELLEYEPQTDAQEHVLDNAIANEGKRMLRERLGKLPQKSELREIKPAHEAESIYILREMERSFDRSWRNDMREMHRSFQRR